MRLGNIEEDLDTMAGRIALMDGRVRHLESLADAVTPDVSSKVEAMEKRLSGSSLCQIDPAFQHVVKRAAIQRVECSSLEERLVRIEEYLRVFTRQVIKVLEGE
jgi:hypothetical protein